MNYDIDLIVKISSAIGFVGVCGMFYMVFFYTESFKNPIGRITVIITIVDLFDLIVKFSSKYPIQNGINSVSCKTQAFILQSTTLTGWLLSFTITFYTTLVVCNRATIITVERMEQYLSLLCLLIPLPLAIYIILATPDGVNPLVGNADFWCWIATAYGFYQLMLLYLSGLILIVLQSICIIYTLVHLKYYIGPDIHGPSLKPYRDFLIKCLLFYTISHWITFVPSFLNRLTRYSLDRKIVVLELLQAITSPMQGMIHYLAFIFSWYSSQTVGYSTQDIQLEQDIFPNEVILTKEDIIELNNLFDVETQMNTKRNSWSSVNSNSMISQHQPSVTDDIQTMPYVESSNGTLTNRRNSSLAT